MNAHVSFTDFFDSLSPQDFAAHRMMAQFLAPCAARPFTPTSAADAAQAMVATQGQNYVGGLTGLHLRAGKRVRHQPKNTTPLDSAMAGGKDIMRTWSQRGTLHFLHPEDFWVVTLCGFRSTSSNIDKRAANWGVDADTYHRIHETVIAFCDQLRSRAEIRDLIEGLVDSAGANPQFPEHSWHHNVSTVTGMTSNVLRHLGARGILLQGPKIGTHDSFIRSELLLQERTRIVNNLAENIRLDGRDLSLQPQEHESLIYELVRRYMESRGPATITDFSWWSTLPKTAAQTAADALTSDGLLLRAQWRGNTYYMAPWHVDVTAKERAAARRRTLHLPPFDEYFMSYADRSALFGRGVDPTTVLTKNGLSWESELRGAQIQGRASQPASQATGTIASS